jgi:hypothetical protein
MAETKRITIQDITDLTVKVLQEGILREIQGHYRKVYYSPIRVPFRYKVTTQEIHSEP